MELRQLRYLAAVLDAGTFTRAARELHVAQSALSHQILQLEREIGAELIRRRRPRVAPTQAGEILLGRARRILAELDAARSDIDGLRGVRTGLVRFGATAPSGSIDLPSLLGSFRARHPGILVRLREGTAGETLEMVRADTLDLALVSLEPAQLPPDVSYQTLEIEDLELICPADHAWASMSVIPLALLNGVQMVSLRSGAGLRQAADTALEAADAVPVVAVESNDLPVVLGLIAAGLGVAILPSAFVRQSAHPLVARPVRPAVRRSLLLVTSQNRRHSHAADAFLSHLTDAAPKPIGQSSGHRTPSTITKL
jgi:LysR family transcriptional activator of glutamate synthase operon